MALPWEGFASQGSICQYKKGKGELALPSIPTQRTRGVSRDGGSLRECWGGGRDRTHTGHRGLQGLIRAPQPSAEMFTGRMEPAALQPYQSGGMRTPGLNSLHPRRWSGARTDSCAARRTLLSLLPTGLRFRLRGPRLGCNYKPGRGPSPLPPQLFQVSPSPSPVVPMQGDRGRPLSCPVREAGEEEEEAGTSPGVRKGSSLRPPQAPPLEIPGSAVRSQIWGSWGCPHQLCAPGSGGWAPTPAHRASSRLHLLTQQEELLSQASRGLSQHHPGLGIPSQPPGTGGVPPPSAHGQ